MCTRPTFKMSDATYHKVVENGFERWECLKCHAKYTLRGEVVSHLKKTHTETMSAYDKHFRAQCGLDSRKCRYCHPEQELGYADVLASIQWRKFVGNSAFPSVNIVLSTLLSIEHRFRNKFSDQHLQELDKCNGVVTASQISRRLEKRVRTLNKNDGVQTPYCKSAFDVASHVSATCCRGCIERWHGFPREGRLSDEQMTYLLKVNMILIRLLKNTTKFREWMSVLPPEALPPYGDRGALPPDGGYYDPTEVRVKITYDASKGTYNVSIKRLKTYFSLPRTPFMQLRRAMKGKSITDFFIKRCKKFLKNGEWETYLNPRSIPHIPISRSLTARKRVSAVRRSNPAVKLRNIHDDN